MQVPKKVSNSDLKQKETVVPGSDAVAEGLDAVGAHSGQVLDDLITL